jgi:hypothetical protein
MTRQYDRMIERELRRDRSKLLAALEQFANIREDEEGWRHFRQRWPTFFPESEYDRVEQGSRPNIFGYPYWLNRIWRGGETVPYLHILLGIVPTPERRDEGTLEETWAYGLISIPPNSFLADWDEGIFRYEGGCDFQRALYLLFRESWRARLCENCDGKFIARRAAQKYCSTDCSENAQRELKRRWWSEHGETWRQERKTSKNKKERQDKCPS